MPALPELTDTELTDTELTDAAMTMDFHPPRAERPGRGIRFAAIALPIGVLGYWFVSWSLLLTAVFMVFLGLIEVLLYRSGARARVVRRGRTALLVGGSVIVVLSTIGGAAISVVRTATAAGLDASAAAVIAIVLTPGATLLTLLVGILAGIGSLIYFTRRFSVPGGADPR